MNADNKKKYISNNSILMAEWDWDTNNLLGLNPNTLTSGSNKRASWICSKCGHIWTTQITKRATRGQGCPICGKEKLRIKQAEIRSKKIREIGSLADIYPELLNDWDWNTNNALGLDPKNLSCGSNQRVSWICHICGHKWTTMIIKRTSRGQGCPTCGKEKLRKKQEEFYKNKISELGSFADIHPELLCDWDYMMNTSSPNEFLATSNKSVFWICSKCGHHWKASIASRSKGSGCKKCAVEVSKKTLLDNLIKQNGSLMDNNPELAKEWHPTKNGDLTPEQVMINTNKAVWWLCHICGYEWKTSVSNRTMGHGCHRCAAQQQRLARATPILGVNDLASQCPDLASEWHPTKNGELTPKDVTRSANKKVWWLGKCGHEWEAIVGSRYLGRGCPICRKEFKVSYPEKAIYYYLHKYLSPISVIENYTADWLKGKELDIFIPELKFAIEYDGENWHTDIDADKEKDTICKKNNINLLRIRESKLPNLDTSTVYFIKGSSDRDDELIKAINYVFKYISNKYKLDISYKIDLNNDRIEIYSLMDFSKKNKSLKNLYPEIANEWHPTKNGRITPEYVSAHSHRKYWWLCPHNHEYDMSVKDRVGKQLNCPICSGHRVLKGFNDLKTKRPEIAIEWHPTLNIDITPSDVMEYSNKKVWWLCPQGHSYQYTIAHRTKNSRNCPICSGRQLCKGINDLVTVNGNIASEWNYQKNGDLRPDQFTPISHKRVWWKCNECGNEWDTLICNRYQKGNGCPKCAGKKRWISRRSKQS